MSDANAGDEEEDESDWFTDGEGAGSEEGGGT